MGWKMSKGFSAVNTVHKWFINTKAHGLFWLLIDLDEKMSKVWKRNIWLIFKVQRVLRYNYRVLFSVQDGIQCFHS